MNETMILIWHTDTTVRGMCQYKTQQFIQPKNTLLNKSNMYILYTHTYTTLRCVLFLWVVCINSSEQIDRESNNLLLVLLVPPPLLLLLFDKEKKSFVCLFFTTLFGHSHFPTNLMKRTIKAFYFLVIVPCMRVRLCVSINNPIRTYALH